MNADSRREALVRQLHTTRVATGHLPPIWLAAQKPPHHFLVRCRRGGFASLAAEVMTLAAPPIRLCPLPGPLHLPADSRGTLLLNDVATLAFADQIALYEWLGAGTGDLRIISVTAAPLAALVARGAFLEGLFHRLGAIQFDLVTGRCSA
jgi:hypothetical protein